MSIRLLIQKIKFILNLLLRKLAPSIGPIGGLEVNDSHIRYFDARRGKIRAIGLRIPPGIIQGGVVTDKKNFLASLLEVRRELGMAQKQKVNVILTLPPEVVYLQAFTLPYLTGENLKNAVNLNLRMISPVPFEDTYADYQVIGETHDGQIEVLGVLAERKNITSLMEVCLEAGLMIVAAEPSIFSLARSIRQIGRSEMEEPNIILSATDAGMDFAGIKNNAVYFNYFVSWRSIYGEVNETPRKIFEENVVAYVGRVLTFFSGHGHADMKKILLVTSSFKETFAEVIRNNFKLEVKEVSFGEWANYGADWAVVMGAYARGLVPGSKDTEANLTGISIKEEFTRYKIVIYVSLWKNVLSTILVFLLIAFVGTHYFIKGVAADLESRGVIAPSQAESAEFKTLVTAAENFNIMVAQVSSTEARAIAIAPYFKKILGLMGQNIVLKRIYFQAFTAPMLVMGSGKNQPAVIDFKNALARASEFSEANLPLTAIQDQEAQVDFSITLSLSSAKSE